MKLILQLSKIENNLFIKHMKLKKIYSFFFFFWRYFIKFFLINLILLKMSGIK